MIEGPKEPKCLKALLQPSVDEFAKYDPGSAQPTRLIVLDASKLDDANHMLPTEVVPLLVSCVADTPFMPLFNESCGHSAKTACCRCYHRGATPGDGTSTVRCDLTHEYMLALSLPCGSGKVRRAYRFGFD